MYIFCFGSMADGIRNFFVTLYEHEWYYNKWKGRECIMYATWWLQLNDKEHKKAKVFAFAFVVFYDVLNGTGAVAAILTFGAAAGVVHFAAAHGAGIRVFCHLFGDFPI